LRARPRRARARRRSRARSPGGLPGQPIHAPDPPLAVGRVPGDRTAYALLPAHPWLPPGLLVQLVVADPQRDHLARTRAEAGGRRHDFAACGPEAGLLADPQDQLRPLVHRDVLALAVDIDVAGDAVRRHRQVTADAVGTEAEVTQRLQLPELDLLS